MSDWDLDPLAEYQHCCGDIKFNCTCNEHYELKYWELCEVMDEWAYTRHERIDGNVVTITLHSRKLWHGSLRLQFDNSQVWDVVHNGEGVLIVEARTDDPRLKETGFIKNSFKG